MTKPRAESAYCLEGLRAIGMPDAGGPWDVSLQHGGAVAALISAIVESVPVSVPMQVARLTIDLMRPVPIAPLDIEKRVLREGKKIQLLQINLYANGRHVVSATGLKVRTTDLNLPDSARLPRSALPGHQAGLPPLPSDRHTLVNPFMDGIAMSVVKGGFRVPGPAAIWYAIERPVIAGVTTSPLMRAAITADFSNGISAVLNYDDWTFLNGDLTVNLARMPQGEWILSEATSWVGPDGFGVASSKLSDQFGYFARCMQTVVFEKRKHAAT